MAQSTTGSKLDRVVFVGSLAMGLLAIVLLASDVTYIVGLIGWAAAAAQTLRLGLAEKEPGQVKGRGDVVLDWSVVVLSVLVLLGGVTVALLMSSAIGWEPDHRVRRLEYLGLAGDMLLKLGGWFVAAIQSVRRATRGVRGA